MEIILFVIVILIIIGTVVQLKLCSNANENRVYIVPVVFVLLSLFISYYMSELCGFDEINTFTYVNLFSFIYFGSIGYYARNKYINSNQGYNNSQPVNNNKQTGSLKYSGYNTNLKINNDLNKQNKDLQIKLITVTAISMFGSLFMFIFLAINTYINVVTAMGVCFSLGIVFFLVMLAKDIKMRLTNQNRIYILLSTLIMFPVSILKQGDIGFAFIPLFLMIGIVCYTALALRNSQLINQSTNKANLDSIGELRFYDNFNLELFGNYNQFANEKEVVKSISRFYSDILKYDENHQEKNILSRAVSVYVPIPFYAIRDFSGNNYFLGAPKKLKNKDDWEYRRFKHYTETFKNTNVFYIKSIKKISLDINYCNDILQKAGLLNKYYVKKIIIVSNVVYQYEAYLILGDKQ